MHFAIGVVWGKRVSARGADMKYVALVLPCVLALCAPLYNRIDPALFAMPFFYWAQLALIPISALGLYLYDRASRG